MTRRTTTPFVLIGALLAGCNAPPEGAAVLLEPELPTTLDDLELVLTEAVDPNRKDVAEHEIAWFVDGERVAELTGEISVPSSMTAKGQEWEVQVTASDDKESAATVSASTVVINTPPSVTVSITPETPLAIEDVEATAPSSDVDDDGVTLTWSWTVNGEPSAIDGPIVPADATLRGDRWEVTVTPNDGEEDGEPATAMVDIQNVPPKVLAGVLSPEAPVETSLLELDIEVVDGDNDPTTVAVDWYVDGALLEALPEDQDTLDGTYFDKGQQVYAVLTPHDGFVDGESFSTNTVTIGNTAPSAASAAIDPTALYEASTATCVPTGWADDDGDAEAYVWSWSVSGVDAGVSTATLTGADFNKGDALICTATPWDGETEGTPVSSESVTVLNTAPVLASADLSSTTPVEGDTLSVTLGSTSDDDGDTVTVSTVWWVNGAAVSTADTLDSSSFVKGDTIYAVLTPNDGEEDGASVTTASATVQNTAPVGVSVSLTPTTAYVTDTLTASASGTDADGDSLTWTYAWTVDGVAVAETGSTLAGGTYFAKDEVVAVTATPNDGEDDGSSVTSSSVTVLNTPPTEPVVAIDPSHPADDEDLVCEVDTASTDADGDTIAYTVSWTLDGAAWTGATGTTTETGDTILAADTEELDLWECTVTPNDGDTDGTAGTDSVTVGETLTVDGTTVVLTEGTYDYALVEVINGGVLQIEGLVEITAAEFTVDASSSVDGAGLGSKADAGSGAGGSGSGAGAGGAGYGGAGGDGGYDSGDTRGPGGSAYGDSTTASISAGSGGGTSDYGSATGAGGAGGAGLSVYAEIIDVAGTIDVTGDEGFGPSGRCGGGGSGGGVLLWADELSVTGSIAADGGAGGEGDNSANDGGGGGGGGRIKLFYDASYTNTATLTVNGGAGGDFGSASSGIDGTSGTSYAASTTWPGL
jgi:hypothetical protein